MIGLDTGHLVYNYGTKLQAFAMQTLLSQNGEDVEIIQWHQKNFMFLNELADFVKKTKKIKNNYEKKYWKLINERYSVLDQFNNKFNIHKFYGNFEKMKKSMQIYNKVFCGSDQAWLPGNVEKHWYTLEFCNDSIFKGAYAPSFGVGNIEDKYKEQYKSFLSRMDAISVREISGQTIIRELLGKEVPVVLDPTLLMTKTDWDKLKKESTIEKPFDGEYVFCYFLGKNKEHRDAVKKIAKDKNLKIVNLAHFSGYCEADVDFADKDLYKVSPQDFIYLIENAKYICTDSFHCTAFSIQYHKDFTVFHRFKSTDTGSTNTRLHSLLGQLGLKNCIALDGEEVKISEINYESVDEILNSLRKKSDTYMQSALRGEKNV